MSEMASFSSGTPFRNESFRGILKKISSYMSLLLRKEFQLFKTELQKDIRSELTMAVCFFIAVVCGFLSLLVLLFTIISVLDIFFKLWVSALIVFLFLTILSLIFILIGFQHSVKAPLGRTKEIIKSDISMTKRGLS